MERSMALDCRTRYPQASHPTSLRFSFPISKVGSRKGTAGIRSDHNIKSPLQCLAQHGVAATIIIN